MTMTDTPSTDSRLRSIEDRLLVIETRLGGLATREDVAGLTGRLDGLVTQADLRKIEVDMIRWMAGLAITIILFVVGFGLTILSRLPSG